MIDFDAMTWTCHFCGDERPDAQVDVVVRWGYLGNTRVVMKATRRFCADRQGCRALGEAWRVDSANAVR